MTSNKGLRQSVIGLAASGFLVFGLAACSLVAGSADSIIKRAAAEGTYEADAADFCDSMIGGYPLISAFSSTVARVRDAAAYVEVKDGWDSKLPTDESTAMVVCIFDVRNVEGVGERYDYMAMLAGYGEESGGNGIITLWAS